MCGAWINTLSIGDESNGSIEANGSSDSRPPEPFDRASVIPADFQPFVMICLPLKSTKR